MARSDYRYNQLAIGDCGHVCNEWPQLTSLEGHNPRIFCDNCEKTVRQLDAEVVLFHYTREPSEFGYRVTGSTRTIGKKPKRKSPPKKRTPKPKTGMALLLEQEGIF